MGQGEAAEQPTEEVPAEAVETAGDATQETSDGGSESAPAGGNGVVVVDFGGVGPEAA